MTVSDPKQPGGSSDESVAQLLGLLHDLACELRPDRAGDLHVGPASRLDRDLGFDSLARAELLMRMERQFDVSLPEELISEAETAHDLLDALGTAAPGRFAGMTAGAAAHVGAAAAWPDTARTLNEVLDWHAGRNGTRPHVILSHGRSDEATITYADLAHDARRIATGLRRWGLEPGGRVAIMLPTAAEFFSVFFGILYAGGVPVPIYPPVRPSQLEEHLRRQAATLANAGASILITVPEARPVGALLRSLAPDLRAVRTAESMLADSVDEAALLKPAPEDLAFLQYTSGSTGDPKGVMLTHANLLANIRAMGQALRVHGGDVFVSWLPLYHDMGLIGAWLGSLYFAVPAVIMSPLTFLARPSNWLWAIHRHRGTLSAAPNFAYELCRTRIPDDEIEGLDLTSWRMAANGAEPVSPAAIRGFGERFAPFGFATNAMSPVYGLAECSVGLAFPPLGREPRIDRISRSELARDGIARPVADGHDPADVEEIVACGHALPGHEMRVVDATGRELADRHEGRLQFRGPSATAGYFGKPERSAGLFDGDWLETGDLAYLEQGDLFMTGRVKDVMIRAGRNIYPQEVEAAVGEVDGIRRGCVAAFGVADPDAGTDRIVILAETRESDPDRRAALQQAVAEAAGDVLGGPPDEVVLAPPQTVLKTSSGKIRRAASRDVYLAGAVGKRASSVWWQFSRLAMRSLLPGLRMGLRTGAALAYAAWWWIVVGTIVGVGWTVVMATPGRRARWTILRAAARLALFATGTRLAIGNRNGELPDGPAIIVCNHASYIDGLVLAAAIGEPLAFIAKGELREHPVAAPALRRLGAYMVERLDTAQSVAGIGELREALGRGEKLVFFAEGTLTRMPGLLAFQMGAFQLAAETGTPVIPVTLRGTRSLLRGDQWFPRHADVSVTVAPAVRPRGTDWQAAVDLRDSVRTEILGESGEPDLIHVRVSDVLGSNGHAN
jgi:1-acyl-sn-glycerol-3-phosphate acyltransferase